MYLYEGMAGFVTYTLITVKWIKYIDINEFALFIPACKELIQLGYKLNVKLINYACGYTSVHALQLITSLLTNCNQRSDYLINWYKYWVDC